MGGGYTDGVPAPTPRRLFFVYLLVSLVVFLRPPHTNFVFDEQEAILANPYLQGELPFYRLLEVDFWGLPAERTIGSYRPLPNLLWRPLSFSLSLHSPWLLTLENMLLHAATASCLARVIFTCARALERGERFFVTWFSGLFFCASALLTEAVSSAVGLADILVGFCTAAAVLVVLQLSAQQRRSFFWGSAAWLRLLFLSFLVFLGLLSKESMLASLALLPLCAALASHPKCSNASRVSLTVLVSLASIAALLAYVQLRDRCFDASTVKVASLVGGEDILTPVRAFLQWFTPPVLPQDPMNNPLLARGTLERVLTSASIFAEQTALFFVPLHLSADFSYPRQLVSGGGPAAWIGGLLFFFLIGVCGRGLVRVARGRELSTSVRLASLGAGLLALSYLPVSGALVALPTVRADRLFYTPALGATLIVGAAVVASRPLGWLHRVRVLSFFLAFSAVQARAHAMHYSSDVVFWRATSAGSPASAKSYLNYGVMVGARGDLDARLKYTKQAVALAPDWSLGQIYLGDTYCRRDDSKRALPHYLKGLELTPNKKSLTALALQCMWEKGIFTDHREQIMNLAAQHPDTWLSYFVHLLSQQGKEGSGIPAQHRPRGYNQVRTER